MTNTTFFAAPKPLTTTMALIMLATTATISAAEATASPIQDIAPVSIDWTITEEACREGSIPNGDNDSFGQRLRLQNRTTTCHPSMGLSSSSVLSFHGAINPVQAIAEDDAPKLAYELWTDPRNSIGPMLTVGSRSWTSPTESLLTKCDEGGFDLQLRTLEDHDYDHNDSSPITQWALIYRTSNVFFEPCHTLRFSSPANTLTHVVLSLEYGRQHVYVNGAKVAHATEALDVRTAWRDSAHQTQVTLLHDADLTTTATTTSLEKLSSAMVYKFALYHPTEFLQKSHAKQLLRHSLPSSNPFCYNQTIRLNEDAEDAAESHDTSWYSTPTSVVDASPLGSNNNRNTAVPCIGWLDRQVEELIWLSEQQHGGDESYISKLAPVYVYVTGLPAHGYLYFQENLVALDFSTIGTAPVIDELIYIPPFNSHSNDNDDSINMTNFTYCLSTKAIFDASQCESSATIWLDVASVNDPPLAVAVPTVVVTEGTGPNSSKQVPIPLTGIDVDEDDSIVQVEILQPPIHGYLSLNVRSFRADLLSHGTPLSSMGNAVSTMEDPLYVQYTWNRPSTLPGALVTVVHAASAVDHFTFRVQDKGGLWSLPERVDIIVESGVEAALNTSDVVAVEDETDQIRWYGVDHSGFDRRVGFFIERVPSASIGFLKDPSTGQVLKAGSTLQAQDNFPYDEGVVVHFEPAEHFCTNVLMTNVESHIQFRVMAYQGSRSDGTVVSVSDSVSQNVTVVCVLDKLTVGVPPGTELSVVETSLVKRSTRSCLTEASDPACAFAAFLTEVQITSHDSKTAKAFVSVSSAFGYITFNELHWKQVEPVLGRRSLASGKVSFYAYPEELTNVLSSLRYESFRPGSDSIEIEIAYGACRTDGARLSSQQSSFFLPSSVCQVENISIPVTILRDDAKFDTTTRFIPNFPWQIFFCIIAYPTLYAAVTFLQNTIAHDINDDETIEVGIPEEPAERFIQHQAGDGLFYYEDTETGTTSWEMPVCGNFAIARDLKRSQSSSSLSRSSTDS